jgi:triacylglycerol esterase/lipase EstA (alpha/beta hydrolase family)
VRAIRRLLWALPVLLTGALVVATVAPTSAGAAPPYHEATIEEVATTAFLRFITLQDPTAPPPGVNDFSCTPSAAHPYPVVLIHGTGGDRYTNWGYLGPHLANAGYCVFALNYGGITPTFVFQGTDAATPDLPGRPSGLAHSAVQINEFIDQVLAATHASQVDLIGHSQGALLALYVPKLTDHASKVHGVIGLGSPTQGSTADGLATLGDQLFGFTSWLNLAAMYGCDRCADVPIPGSLLIQRLSAGGVAVPGIRYTEIASNDDRVATPATNDFVPVAQQPPAEQPLIANVLMQDVCPAETVGHIGEAYDANVAQVILNALDPAHPTPVTCGPSGPNY